MTNSDAKLEPFFVCSLPLAEHRRKFKAAAFDIELILEGTRATIVAVANYEPGEPPPRLDVRLVNIAEGFGEDEESGPYTFAGYIEGPALSEEASLDPASSNWGKQVLSILAEHGLKHVGEETCH